MGIHFDAKFPLWLPVDPNGRYPWGSISRGFIFALTVALGIYLWGALIGEMRTLNMNNPFTYKQPQFRYSTSVGIFDNYL